jgi:hypothetical protein
MPFALPFPIFTPPGGAVAVSVGANLQSLIDANPDGTVFVLAAGIHRIGSIAPKQGNQFYGTTSGGNLQTICNGSVVATGWVADGPRWKVTGMTQENGTAELVSGDPKTVNGFERAVYREDVFIDGIILRHALSINQVTADTFYFDYPNDTVYIGVDPSGKTVEISFHGSCFDSTNSGVVVRNLIIEKYASSTTYGGIAINGSDWVVEGNDVRWNHCTGISVRGNNSRYAIIRKNYCHDNGLCGILTWMDARDALIENNETSDNNKSVGYALHWNSAGIKVMGRNSVIRGNYIHDNYSRGIWLDVTATAIVIEENLVLDNELAGICTEIAFNTVVRNNRVKRNGTNPNTGGSYTAQIGGEEVSYSKVYNNYIQAGPMSGNAIQYGSAIRDNPQAHTIGTEVYSNYVNILNDGTLGLDAAGEKGEAGDFEIVGLNLFKDNQYFISAGKSPNKWILGSRYGGSNKLSLIGAHSKGFDLGSEIVGTSFNISETWAFIPASNVSNTPSLITTYSKYRKATIIGQWNGLNTDTLQVTINGVTYTPNSTEGIGFIHLPVPSGLHANIMGNFWSLTIPVENELPRGSYTVSMSARNKVTTSTVYTSSATLVIDDRITFPIYTPSAGAIQVAVDDNLQALINANPINTEFVLAAGTHKLNEISPKQGNAFYGTTNGSALQTVVTGADVVTTTTQEHGAFVLTGQTQNGGIWYTGGKWINNEKAWESEATPESVFIDDQFLKHVSTSKIVTSTDTLSFSNGNKIINFTPNLPHDWVLNQLVRIINYEQLDGGGDSPDWMEGRITALTNSSMTVNVTSFSVTSGETTTRSAWSVKTVLTDAGAITVVNSSTSHTIGTGNKTFIIANGNLSGWKVGWVKIRAAAFISANNYAWVEGDITAISDTSITIAVTATKGGGTYSDWELTEVTTGTFYFDYVNNKIYIGSDPTGKKLEVTRNTRSAINATATDVKVYNLIVEKYASQAMTPAALSFTGSRSQVSGCEVRLTHGAGVVLNGTDSVISRCYIHDIGSKGVGLPGQRSLMEGCEVGYINVKRFYIGYDAAGVKSSGDNCYIRRNWFYECYCRGIWTDVDCINIIVEDNIVERATIYAICLEVSYACAALGNKARKNLRPSDILEFPRGQPNAVISSQSSQDCLIANNIAIAGDNIAANMGIDTTYQEGRHLNDGVPRTKGNIVRNNDIYHLLSNCKSGSVGDAGPYLGSRFYDNRYHVVDPDGGFLLFTNIFADTSSLKKAIYRGHEIGSIADSQTPENIDFNYWWAESPTLSNTPTVDPIKTAQTSFYISGRYNSANARSIQVIANGISYTTANGLTLNARAGRWAVKLNNVAPGTIDVIVRVTGNNGTIFEDSTSNQVIVDPAQPPTPTVSFLTTSDTTPLVTGGYGSGNVPSTIALLINGQYYLEQKTIDSVSALSIGSSSKTFKVVGGLSKGWRVGDILRASTTISPGVTGWMEGAITSITDTSIVISPASNSGSSGPTTYNAWVISDQGLTIDNQNSTWAFQMPTALPFGTYNVGVSTISHAGEYTDITSNNSLVIGNTVTLLARPSINRLISYIKYPILTGKYDPLATAVSVTVDGITYTTSNGLGLNPLLGLWSLLLPSIPDGTYSVTVTTSDANGSISDNTSVELIVSDIPNSRNHGYRFSLTDNQIS